jgi:hypothetical protein
VHAGGLEARVRGSGEAIAVCSNPLNIGRL